MSVEPVQGNKKSQNLVEQVKQNEATALFAGVTEFPWKIKKIE